MNLRRTAAVVEQIDDARDDLRQTAAAVRTAAAVGLAAFVLVALVAVVALTRTTRLRRLSI